MLRDIPIHDLRDTFASLLIQQGESLAHVRDQVHPSRQRPPLRVAVSDCFYVEPSAGIRQRLSLSNSGRWLSRGVRFFYPSPTAWLSVWLSIVKH